VIARDAWRPLIGVLVPVLFMLIIGLAGVRLSTQIRTDEEALREHQHQLLNMVDASRSAQLFYQEQQENWRALIDSKQEDTFDHYRRQMRTAESLVIHQLDTLRGTLVEQGLGLHLTDHIIDLHQRLGRLIENALALHGQDGPYAEWERAVALTRGLEQQLSARLATLTGSIVLEANRQIDDQNALSQATWTEARALLLWLTLAGVGLTAFIAWRNQVASSQLRQTLERLRRAQQELVNSEKLASLGSLVAGVAHELNTPLGNGVLLASSLQDQVREFSGHLQAGTIQRRTMSEFCSQATDTCNLLEQSLERSVEIVGHFKQVAVDQSSDRRRSFYLDAAIEDICGTLQPQFRATPHRLIVTVEPELTLEGYPGTLGQILNNLVLNALQHGLESHPGGEVRVEAGAMPGQRIRLTVSDNGKGIPIQDRSQIFDPFFTTRLGAGGSGLGLYIVHNLVTGVLGGTLTVDSSPRGTAFQLVFPAKAPQRRPSRTT